MYSVDRKPQSIRSRSFQPRRFGKYLLVDRLGTGAAAEVFRARVENGSDSDDVAVKRILQHIIENENFVSMFIDEAAIMASLRHPNIVEIFEFGDIDGSLYITMEFIPGDDLHHLTEVPGGRRVKMPLEAALYTIMEVLKGLDFAHNARDSQGNELRIIHRDVSPNNILVTDDGNVKLADFGIAKSTLRKSFTLISTGKGKIGYMSPEQVSNDSLDRRSDIFSTGVVLFETITGRALFQGQSDLDILLQIRDARVEESLASATEIPPEFKAILLRALAREPADRFQSAAAFYRAIGDYVRAWDLRVTAGSLAAFVRDRDRSAPQDAKRRRRRSADFDPVAVEQAASPDDHGGVLRRKPTSEETQPIPVTRARRFGGPMDSLDDLVAGSGGAGVSTMDLDPRSNRGGPSSSFEIVDVDSGAPFVELTVGDRITDLTELAGDDEEEMLSLADLEVDSGVLPRSERDTAELPLDSVKLSGIEPRQPIAVIDDISKMTVADTRPAASMEQIAAEHEARNRVEQLRSRLQARSRSRAAHLRKSGQHDPIAGEDTRVEAPTKKAPDDKRPTPPLPLDVDRVAKAAKKEDDKRKARERRTTGADSGMADGTRKWLDLPGDVGDSTTESEDKPSSRRQRRVRKVTGEARVRRVQDPRLPAHSASIAAVDDKSRSGGFGRKGISPGEVAPVGRPARYTSAEISLSDEVLESAPDSALASAISLRRSGDFAEALSLIDDNESFEEHALAALFEHAVGRIGMEEYSQAAEELEELLQGDELNEDDAVVARYYLGLSYEALGDKFMAMPHFDLVASLAGERFPDVKLRLNRLRRL